MLQVISDLHFEFCKDRVSPSEFVRQCVIPREPILALCGDIGRACDVDKMTELLRCLKSKFEHVLWVPGNHEFYENTVPNAVRQMEDIAAASNTTLLNNDHIDIGSFRFIGSTLWSHIPQADIASGHIERCMNDYHSIKFANGVKLTPNHTNGFHAECANYLDMALQTCVEDGKDAIVLTHYLPSLQVVDEKYIDSPFNAAFATALDDVLIKKHSNTVALWAFGHSHSSVSQQVGGVHLLSNPRGYPSDGGASAENDDYDVGMTIGT